KGWPRRRAYSIRTRRVAGAVGQAPYVGCEQVQLAFVEHLAEHRHLVRATLVDRFDDRRQPAAVQPGLVGEIRRAERDVALAGFAVAGRASGRTELFLSL